MKILLVDDNSEHKELIRLALTGYDSTWEVEAVTSAEEALRRLLGGDVFDLVLLDYSMPGRDGLEVLEEIRRGETPLPVVMVTGRGDEQVAVKAMKGGVYDYVVKGGSYLQRLPVVAQRAVEAYQLTVDRKQAEKELRESEERFKRVANNLGEWIWEVNADGLYTYSSPFVENILGYKPEEVVGKMHFYDLFAPEKKEGLKKAAFDMFARKKSFKGFVNPNLHKNGTLVFVATSGAPVLDQQGRLLGYCGGDIDITERKQAKETLRESEKKYRALIETTGTGYVILDFAGKVLDANDEYARLTGHERRDEILGRSVVEWTAAYDIERNAQAVEKCFRQGFIQNLELDYVGHQGQTIPIEGNGTLVTTKSGPQILALCREITERKKTEEEREKLIVELRASLEKVKTLSGLLPICASCKRIRDDKGYWKQIDSYIREHSEVEFSHGICPECMKKLYPDFEIVE